MIKTHDRSPQERPRLHCKPDLCNLQAVVDTFQPHIFSQITTESGPSLQLSQLHYLPVSAVQGTKLSTAVYKQAADVAVGDFLWSVNEWATESMYAARVTGNVNVTAYGDVMPLTMKVCWHSGEHTSDRSTCTAA